jgi:hypothetical protein
MRRTGLFIAALTISISSLAQLDGDIMLSMSVANNANLGLNGKSVIPFVGGVNFYYKLTKKKYSPLNISLYSGVRYAKTGYRMEGYLDTRPEFYKENNIVTYSDDVKSKLIQNFINVPFGLEFRIDASPVKKKKINVFALTVLLNNGFLLSSKLTESLETYTDEEILRQSVDLKPYLKSYYPGLTLDLRLCTWFNTGLTIQTMNYEKAEADLDFNDMSKSPFYQMITDDGVYHDIYYYVGLTIPLGALHKK